MTAIRALFCIGLLGLTGGCASPATRDGGEPTTQILATGAEISGANGLLFGPDGLLYVASVLGSEIVVLDPESGGVIRRIREDVNSPDDVAFTSDGNLYWTSILSGEVAGLRPDGTRILAAQLTSGSNPITTSTDDRLFVSQCFFGSNLYEVDPNGLEAPRLISDELGPHCGLNGMDWGPDDRLYGPRWFDGEVVSFDVDTGEMRVEAADFKVPAAIKFDSKGILHVLDTAEGSVVRVDGDTRVIVARLEPGLDNLAFDTNDRLFISSFVDGSVMRVDADGRATPIAPAGLAHPGGLTLRNAERGPEIVVADLQSIRGFDAVSGESTFVERNVFGVSELGAVSNIATDGANLILTSWLDGTVKVWDPSARKVLDRYTGLSGAVSAIRHAGRIFVAEHGEGRVIAYPDGNDRTLGTDDTEDAAPTDEYEVIVSGLRAPTGLAERDGGLYLTDRLAGQLLKIADEGVPLTTVEVVASGLSSPEGVAATDEGFLVRDGESGQVLEINVDGEIRLLTTLSPGLPAPTKDQPPSMIFNGIVVDAQGTSFATGESNRVLYRINPR